MLLSSYIQNESTHPSLIIIEIIVHIVRLLRHRFEQRWSISLTFKSASARQNLTVNSTEWLQKIGSFCTWHRFLFLQATREIQLVSNQWAFCGSPIGVWALSRVWLGVLETPRLHMRASSGHARPFVRGSSLRRYLWILSKILSKLPFYHFDSFAYHVITSS